MKLSQDFYLCPFCMTSFSYKKQSIVRKTTTAIIKGKGVQIPVKHGGASTCVCPKCSRNVNMNSPEDIK